jgi:hypothetical protein
MDSIRGYAKVAGTCNGVVEQSPGDQTHVTALRLNAQEALHLANDAITSFADYSRCFFYQALAKSVCAIHLIPQQS